MIENLSTFKIINYRGVISDLSWIGNKEIEIIIITAVKWHSME